MSWSPLRINRPRAVARKSKEMAPNSKELRVGMAYITANRIPAGEQHRQASPPGRGAGREGRRLQSAAPPSHAPA